MVEETEEKRNEGGECVGKKRRRPEAWDWIRMTGVKSIFGMVKFVESRERAGEAEICMPYLYCISHVRCTLPAAHFRNIARLRASNFNIEFKYLQYQVRQVEPGPLAVWNTFCFDRKKIK